MPATIVTRSADAIPNASTFTRTTSVPLQVGDFMYLVMILKDGSNVPNVPSNHGWSGLGRNNNSTIYATLRWAKIATATDVANPTWTWSFGGYTTNGSHLFVVIRGQDRAWDFSGESHITGTTGTTFNFNPYTLNNPNGLLLAWAGTGSGVDTSNFTGPTGADNLAMTEESDYERGNSTSSWSAVALYSKRYSVNAGFVLSGKTGTVNNANAYTMSGFIAIPDPPVHDKAITIATSSQMALNRLLRFSRRISIATPSTMSINRLQRLSRAIQINSASVMSLSTRSKRFVELAFSSSGQMDLRKMIAKTLKLSSSGTLVINVSKTLSKEIFISSPSEMIINRVQPLYILISSPSQMSLDATKAKLVEIFFSSGSTLDMQKTIFKTLEFASTSDVSLHKLVSKLIEIKSTSQMLLKIGNSYVVEIWVNSESNMALQKTIGKVLNFSTSSKIISPLFALPSKAKRFINRIGV